MTALAINFNWKMVCAAGFFMACSLLVFYAFLVNELTGGTYLIKNYNSQIENLGQENRNLEVSFAKTGFLETIEQKAKELNFEKTTSVKYVQILDASLAKAK
ncbi:MAG: hypothetical protein AAB925_02505 [Patescibacteria group bacterium]